MHYYKPRVGSRSSLDYLTHLCHVGHFPIKRRSTESTTLTHAWSFRKSHKTNRLRGLAKMFLTSQRVECVLSTVLRLITPKMLTVSPFVSFPSSPPPEVLLKFKTFLAMQFKREDPFALLSNYVHHGSVTVVTIELADEGAPIQHD